MPIDGLHKDWYGTPLNAFSHQVGSLITVGTRQYSSRSKQAQFENPVQPLRSRIYVSALGLPNPTETPIGPAYMNRSATNDANQAGKMNRESRAPTNHIDRPHDITVGMKAWRH